MSRGGASAGERLESALAGDRDAWAEIVDEYTNLLWWIARGYRLDDATAADVVQTTWLQLVRSGGTITNPDRLASWLSTTARREALKRAKQRDRQEPTDTIADTANPLAPAVDEALLDEELQADALRAFAQIGEKCRRLLALLCQDPPPSYAEVASILGKTHGYIGATRARCLDRLRHAMETAG